MGVLAPMMAHLVPIVLLISISLFWKPFLPGRSISERMKSRCPRSDIWVGRGPSGSIVIGSPVISSTSLGPTRPG